MSRLFIDLYLDEDVDVLVAELVRARGFDVQTTRDAGNLGLGDEEQMAFAAEEGRALVTHNRVDFEVLARRYYHEERRHAGIIFAVRRLPHEIAQRLLVLLNHVTAEEMAGQVRYI